MSIMDLILQQTAIIASLGLALGILVVAVSIALVAWVKTQKTEKAKKAKQVRHATKPEDVREYFDIGANDPAPLAEPEQTVESPNLLTTDTESSEEEKKEKSGDEKVNTLLSDVFEDEGQNEDYQILMEGIEPPTIEDLLALATHVSTQLASRSPNPIS